MLVDVPKPSDDLETFKRRACLAISRLATSKLGQNASPQFAGLTIGGGAVSNTLIGQWNTAFGWGNHAGLYDPVGSASGAVGDHEATYDHTLLHSPVTLGTANGLTLNGQEISLPTTATPTFDSLTLSRLLSVRRENSAGQVVITTYRDNPSGSFFGGQLARGTIDNPAVVQLNDETFALYGYGYSATAGAFRQCAWLKFEIDGTPDSGGDTTDMPGRLAFGTTPDGASAPVERMRIGSNGYVGIGTDAPDELLHVSAKVRADTAFNLNGTDGITTTFVDNDGNTITVTGGIITAKTAP